MCPITDAPKAKKVLTEVTAIWLNSARHRQGQEKGRAVRQDEMQMKFDALMATHQVRQALASRHDPNKDAKTATILQRIDYLTALHANPDAFERGRKRVKKNSAALSVGMSIWATFYDETESPGGLRYLP